MASDVSKREHEARALVDARSYGGRCELHGGLGSNVHHRNKQGRVWAASNLLRLCGSGTTGCHGWIEAHPVYAMVLGLWVPRALDPATVPMLCKPALFHLGWWLADDEGMWHQADPPAASLERARDRQVATEALWRFLATYSRK